MRVRLALKGFVLLAGDGNLSVDDQDFIVDEVDEVIDEVGDFSWTLQTSSSTHHLY